MKILWAIKVRAAVTLFGTYEVSTWAEIFSDWTSYSGRTAYANNHVQKSDRSTLSGHWRSLFYVSNATLLQAFIRQYNKNQLAFVLTAKLKCKIISYVWSFMFHLTFCWLLTEFRETALFCAYFIIRIIYLCFFMPDSNTSFN